MNHSEEAAADFCSINLSERLKRVRLNAIEPLSSSQSKGVQYKQMIENMLEKAVENDRNFMKDIFVMILIYISESNNIDRLLEKWHKSDERRENFITMKRIYDLRSHCEFYECYPTLSRIATAFSHVTLVLTDMMKNNPDYNLRPRFWLSTKDLGAVVHDHFKMAYYPGMIVFQDCSFKLQVGLFLHNLCHAKAIAKSGSERSISTAFVSSCHIAFGIINQQMAPLQAREQFTALIENMDFDAEMLSKVWNTVIGTISIPLTRVTRLTCFHEKVLKAQPLDEHKWRQIMEM